MYGIHFHLLHKYFWLFFKNTNKDVIDMNMFHHPCPYHIFQGIMNLWFFSFSEWPLPYFCHWKMPPHFSWFFIKRPFCISCFIKTPSLLHIIGYFACSVILNIYGILVKCSPYDLTHSMLIWYKTELNCKPNYSFCLKKIMCRISLSKKEMWILLIISL